MTTQFEQKRNLQMEQRRHEGLKKKLKNIIFGVSRSMGLYLLLILQKTMKKPFFSTWTWSNPWTMSEIFFWSQSFKVSRQVNKQLLSLKNWRWRILSFRKVILLRIYLTSPEFMSAQHNFSQNCSYKMAPLKQKVMYYIDITL